MSFTLSNFESKKIISVDILKEKWLLDFNFYLAVTVADACCVPSKQKTLGLSLFSLCCNINIIKCMEGYHFLVITCGRKITICVWDLSLQTGNKILHSLNLQVMKDNWMNFSDEKPCFFVLFCFAFRIIHNLAQKE